MSTISIPGEGEQKVVIKTRVRVGCYNCGEHSTKKFLYCYVNGRSNPASSMYGRDDCSYCSDSFAFACDECEHEVKRACCPVGMEWGGTFTLGPRNGHVFLHWQDRAATDDELCAIGHLGGSK